MSIKIDANSKSVRELLDGVKYGIDYYQREYKWETKQVAELLEDLEAKFLDSYEPEHERSKHAPHDVAKNLRDWEYTVEILHSDLRARLRDQLHPSPPRSVLSHEGSIPQGPGAAHVQRLPSKAAAAGGQGHV